MVHTSGWALIQILFDRFGIVFPMHILGNKNGSTLSMCVSVFYSMNRLMLQRKPLNMKVYRTTAKEIFWKLVGERIHWSKIVTQSQGKPIRQSTDPFLPVHLPCCDEH